MWANGLSETGQLILSVLDRDPGCCLYPGIPGTNSWGMGVAGGATQAETSPGLPSAQRGSSRDPVTREETWTRSASYRFKTW